MLRQAVRCCLCVRGIAVDFLVVIRVNFFVYEDRPHAPLETCRLLWTGIGVLRCSRKRTLIGARSESMPMTSKIMAIRSCGLMGVVRGYSSLGDDWPTTPPICRLPPAKASVLKGAQ